MGYFHKCLCGIAAVAIAACSNGGSAGLSSNTNAVQSLTRTGASTSLPSGPGYAVSLIIKGNAQLSNPDSLISTDRRLYVGFQNKTGPTGTGGDSTIAEYKPDGTFIKSINVPGRCDGMRRDPYTHLIWLTVNEDANSSLFTWDEITNTLKHYTYSESPLPHGGGTDDLAFVNGKAFVAASNPTLNGAGINTGPAIYGVTLQGSTAVVTPVLYGNATATDIASGDTVTLNLTDPDSMTVAPNHDVVLVSQADSEIVFVRKAGTSSQTVSRLLVGTQLDDTVYANDNDGRLYVADTAANSIYVVHGQFSPNTVYTEAPSDSGVAGFVGTVNLTNGTITPVITGFSSPSGLVFQTDDT